jgi:hypothetical protein
VLSGITALAEGDAEFYLRARGPLLRPAGESKTGISPRTPSIVSRTCKLLHPQAARSETFRNPNTRAPIRLLPIRAPRQAVLRTSFRLAPSRVTNRPCDLPVEKTRDASNRCLPPKRTACTRTSRVPGSLSQLSLRGRPTESKAPCGMTGGPDVSRRPRVRFGGPSSDAALRASCLTAVKLRAWAFSSHGVNAVEPLTPLSRSSFHPHASLRFGSAATWPGVLLLEGFARVGGCEDRRDHR